MNSEKSTPDTHNTQNIKSPHCQPSQKLCKANPRFRHLHPHLLDQPSLLDRLHLVHLRPPDPRPRQSHAKRNRLLFIRRASARGNASR